MCDLISLIIQLAREDVLSLECLGEPDFEELSFHLGKIVASIADKLTGSLAPKMAAIPSALLGASYERLKVCNLAWAFVTVPEWCRRVCGVDRSQGLHRRAGRRA